MKLTKQMLEAGKSDAGGFNLKQLKALGLPLPAKGWPPAGWPTRLIGSEVTDAQYQEFLALRKKSNNVPQGRAKWEADEAKAERILDGIFDPADQQKEIDWLTKELRTSNHALAVLTDEREQFVQFCQLLKLATGEVGPIQVARAHIDRLKAENAELRATITKMHQAWMRDAGNIAAQRDKLALDLAEATKPSDTLIR